MKLKLNSDKRKNPELRDYRNMTLAEIMALSYNAHPLIVLNNGNVGTVKINGAIKTWKREPGKIEVPVKYGMYECARFDTDEALRRFIVEA